MVGSEETILLYVGGTRRVVHKSLCKRVVALPIFLGLYSTAEVCMGVLVGWLLQHVPAAFLQ